MDREAEAEGMVGSDQVRIRPKEDHEVGGRR